MMTFEVNSILPDGDGRLPQFIAIYIINVVLRLVSARLVSTAA